MKELIFGGLRTARFWRRPSVESVPASRLSLFGRLRRNRRGAVALTFGISAIVFLGVSGLATEVGYWYFAHRHGQNAADAAASAGALVRSENGAHSVIVARATDVATQNGFTSGGAVTVTVNHPPVNSTCCNGDQNSVEVIVNQVQTPNFARLFRISSETVSSRAVAKVTATGNACVLALGGDPNGVSLWLTGNFTAKAPNCELASNYTGATGIQVGGSSTVIVQSLYTAGGCTGCSSSNVTATYPPQTYSPAIPDPFANVAAVTTWPSLSSSNCTKVPTSNGTSVTLVPYGGTQIGYCGLKMNGQTVNSQGKVSTSADVYVMDPGVYFFVGNVDIGGGSLTCSSLCTDTAGVSIVILPDASSGNVGTLNINAQAIVTLNAGSATSNAYPALDGVLFYRDDTSTGVCGDCGGSTEIQINGGASTTLKGGFYFPKADVTYNGNSGSNCTVIVGGTVTMNGTATLNQTGCDDIGTGVPRTQIVALVE